jgi:hypothetical protein
MFHDHYRLTGDVNGPLWTDLRETTLQVECLGPGFEAFFAFAADLANKDVARTI